MSAYLDHVAAVIVSVGVSLYLTCHVSARLNVPRDVNALRGVTLPGGARVTVTVLRLLTAPVTWCVVRDVSLSAAMTPCMVASSGVYALRLRLSLQ